MPASDSFAQSSRLRFDDAELEAAYQQDRAQRDAVRASRVQLVLGIIFGVLGTIIVTVSLLKHTPVSRTWLVLRFGIMVPVLLGSALLVRQPWGRRHQQAILGLGVALVIGAHSLSWFMEWVPGLSLRSLWMVPMISLWAAAMTLPLNARTAIFATIGTLIIAQTGIVFIVPNLDLITAATTAFAYALCGYGLVLLARWRERDNRELFLNRNQAERLAGELRVQYAALQQLIEQRNEFVAGVLHDLRSPLTGILLNTGLLRSADSLPPAVRAKMLDDIATSAKRVDAFANRFLEQRSLERAATTPTLAPLALEPVVERAIGQARLSAGNKAQRVLFEPAATVLTVVADELLLDRALGNLLDNAVKYSPHGATITVRVTVETTVPPRARVAVIDPGPGLSAAEQARLFQPYAIIEKKPTGGEPSTGLGLSLVKHCIEGMGGTVGCESELGRGATFWLALKCG